MPPLRSGTLQRYVMKKIAVSQAVVLKCDLPINLGLHSNVNAEEKLTSLSDMSKISSSLRYFQSPYKTEPLQNCRNIPTSLSHGCGRLSIYR